MNSRKIEGSALLVGFLAFCLLAFAITVTVALPLMDSSLYAEGKSAPRYSGTDQYGQAIDPLVAEGRRIYMREGCFYCHTQQVRTIDNDKAFQGKGQRPTQPDDYANDNPALLGSERQGPDLKFVGDRITSLDWHIQHFNDPRGLVPGSLMPSYKHLPDRDKEALAAYLLQLRDWSFPPDKDKPKALAPLKNEDVPEKYAGLTNPFKPGDAAAVAAAKTVVEGKCIVCHGADYKGKLLGNVQSANWLESAGKRSDQFLYWAITEGAQSGMPPWKQALTDEQRWQLVTFIKSLKP